MLYLLMNLIDLSAMICVRIIKEDIIPRGETDVCGKCLVGVPCSFENPSKYPNRINKG